MRRSGPGIPTTCTMSRSAAVWAQRKAKGCSSGCARGAGMSTTRCGRWPWRAAWPTCAIWRPPGTTTEGFRAPPSYRGLERSACHGTAGPSALRSRHRDLPAAWVGAAAGGAGRGAGLPSDAACQYEGLAHSPGCSHRRQERGVGRRDDLVTIEELLGCEGFAPCSKCGGYAVRRLTEVQVAYYRAAHRLHDLAQQVRTVSATAPLTAEELAAALEEFTALDRGASRRGSPQRGKPVSGSGSWSVSPRASVNLGIGVAEELVAMLRQACSATTDRSITAWWRATACGGQAPPARPPGPPLPGVGAALPLVRSRSLAGMRHGRAVSRMERNAGGAMPADVMG